MPRILLLAISVAMVLPSPLRAQDWARKMFEATSHDFGSIARGAKAEYEFVLTNLYVEDVHIAGLRVTCGCTTPRITKEWLKTYEKGGIIASINSNRFLGQQGSTIVVTIDKPYYAEVQLHVKVYVRSDLVLDPASVSLGSVDHGSEVEKTISVSYAGRSDWQIVEAKSANPHISAKVAETGRSDDQVTYALKVRLNKGAPPGQIKEYVILVSNDQKASQIPVAVEGEVLSDITVSPASLFIGAVKPGEKVTKQVVVRSKKPFRITSVSSECKCLEITAPSDGAAKSLYLIPVTFVAGPEGHVTKTIRIQTDRNSAQRELSVHAAVAR